MQKSLNVFKFIYVFFIMLGNSIMLLGSQEGNHSKMWIVFASYDVSIQLARSAVYSAWNGFQWKDNY